MDKAQFEELTKKVDSLTRALRAIAHGDQGGATGLEMLAIAMAGDGLTNPVGKAIRDGLSEVAEAMQEGLERVANAIEYAAKQNQPEVKE